MKKILFILGFFIINFCLNLSFAYYNNDYKYSFSFDIPSGWYEFTKDEFNQMSQAVSTMGGNRISTPVTILKHTPGKVDSYPFIVVNYSNAEGIFSSWNDFKNQQGIIDSNSMKEELNNINTSKIKLSKLNYDYIYDDGKEAIMVLSDVSYNNGNNTQQISAMFYKYSHFVSVSMYVNAGELEKYLEDFYSIINSFHFDVTAMDLFGSNKKEEKKINPLSEYIDKKNKENFDYEYVVVEDEDDGYSLGDIGSKAGRAFMIIFYTFIIIIYLIILGIFIKNSFVKATDMKFIDVIKRSLQTALAKFSKKNPDNFRTYAPYKPKEMGKKILDIMKGTGYIVLFGWFIGIFAIPIIGVINDEETEDIFIVIGIMFLAGFAAIIGIPLIRYLALAIVGCLMIIFYCIPCFIFCFIIGLLGYTCGKISKLFNPKKKKKL